MPTHTAAPAQQDLAILDVYHHDAPSPQHAVDIFEGEWSSVLPRSAGADSGGFAPLFADQRIDWMVDVLGGVAGRRILELGPLEGGHSHALEVTHGAGRIVAVEANQRAYLKCLIVKEILGLERTSFLLGDANRHMETSDERHDLVVASGVLYHMEDPARHIELLCRSGDAVFVWTHYFDAERIAARGEAVAKKFGATRTVVHDGYEHTVYRQDYLEALGWGGFCGAGNEFAHWLELSDIRALFDRYGFDITDEAFHDPDHTNGPAIAFVARRR